MNEEIQTEMAVAHEALLAAEHLYRVNLLRDSGTRIYFAMFHAASAMLLVDRKRFKSHGETIGAFGLFFAKTKRVEPKFHRYLIDGDNFREIADYMTPVPIKREDVSRWIEKAREFLAMAEDFLRGTGGKSENA